MAITYPIDFPTDLGVNNFTLRQRTAVSRTESPFTFSEQVYDWGGQIWEIEANLPLMNRATAEIYNSFLFKLKGKKGTFTMAIPGAGAPRGTVTGTPVVNGASQTGSSLNVSGFGTSDTGVLLAGDYIQIGTGSSTRLYKVLDDVNSDGSGNATLEIFPDLRSSPSNGAAIITSNAKGLFRLRDNMSPVTIDVNSFYSIKFSAIEALNGT